MVEDDEGRWAGEGTPLGGLPGAPLPPRGVGEVVLDFVYGGFWMVRDGGCKIRGVYCNYLVN